MQGWTVERWREDVDCSCLTVKEQQKSMHTVPALSLTRVTRGQPDSCVRSWLYLANFYCWIRQGHPNLCGPVELQHSRPCYSYYVKQVMSMTALTSRDENTPEAVFIPGSMPAFGQESIRGWGKGSVHRSSLCCMDFLVQCCAFSSHVSYS